MGCGASKVTDLEVPPAVSSKAPNTAEREVLFSDEPYKLPGDEELKLKLGWELKANAHPALISSIATLYSGEMPVHQPLLPITSSDGTHDYLVRLSTYPHNVTAIVLSFFLVQGKKKGATELSECIEEAHFTATNSKGKHVAQFRSASLDGIGKTNCLFAAIHRDDKKEWCLQGLGVFGGPTMPTTGPLSRLGKGRELRQWMRESGMRPDMTGLTAFLTVTKARELKGADLNGKADPYLTVTTTRKGTEEVMKTEPQKGTLDPEWGSEKGGKFTIRDLTARDTITMTITDKDKIGDDVMGFHKVNIYDALVYQFEHGQEEGEWSRVADLELGKGKQPPKGGCGFLHFEIAVRGPGREGWCWFQ